MDQSAHNAFEGTLDLCAIYFSDKFIRLAMIADLFMINNDAILRSAATRGADRLRAWMCR